MIPVSFTGFYREDYHNTRTIYFGTVQIGTIEKITSDNSFNRVPSNRIIYVVKDLTGEQMRAFLNAEEAEEYAKRVFASFETYREELEIKIKLKVTAFMIVEKNQPKYKGV